MGDLPEKVANAVTHPNVTIAAGASTATYGALNKVAETLPVIHDILSDACMLGGVIATMIGIAVQVRNYQIRTLDMQARMRRRKSDRES